MARLAEADSLALADADWLELLRSRFADTLNEAGLAELTEARIDSSSMMQTGLNSLKRIDSSLLEADSLELTEGEEALAEADWLELTGSRFA